MGRELTIEASQRTSAISCGFNRSMQHTRPAGGRRSVAHEAATADLLLGQPKGADVGALEARGDAPSDCWLFDRMHSSVHRILAETGGIRPPERRRSSRALSLAEREEVSRAVVAGESIRAIAARLARAPSTVSREIKQRRARRLSSNPC